jgi:hypothetical protein
MKNKIVKDIIEFALQCMDWDCMDSDPKICLKCVEDLLTEKINIVICDTGVLAVIQCNDRNNNEEMAGNGELVIGVLLVDTNDLTTDHLTANARIESGIVTVSFEVNW